jgi:hypothetical protein
MIYFRFLLNPSRRSEVLSGDHPRLIFHPNQPSTPEFWFALLLVIGD